MSSKFFGKALFLAFVIFSILLVNAMILPGPIQGYLKESYLPGEKISFDVCSYPYGNDLNQAQKGKIEVFRLNSLNFQDTVFHSNEYYAGIAEKSSLISSDELDFSKGDCVGQEFVFKESGLYVFKKSLPDYYYTEESNLEKTAPKLRDEYSVAKVTNIGIISKSNGKNLSIFVLDLNSGYPVPGAKVSILTKTITEGFATDSYSEKSLGETDEKGFVSVQPEKDSSGFVVANFGNNYASSNFYSYYNSSGILGYVFTDRPVYRSGQNVFFKAIAVDETSSKAYYSNKELVVTIRDPKYNEVFKKTIITNSFGAVSGEFLLGDEVALGSYNVTISTLDGASLAYADFEVQDYKKPEYKVDLVPENSSVVKGQKARVKAKVEYFFGSPVDQAELVYEVRKNSSFFPCRYFDCYFINAKIMSPYPNYGYGEIIASGKTITSSFGEAVIEFDTNSLDEYDTEYSVVVTAFDKSKKSVQASTIVKSNTALFRLYAS
ncbi:MAG: MG2 domain-containing protein, partial [Candidatus Diapherotrites archaeon]|nr:MG2 domain-containing protein [Candidatus Diapherotrites archaeon]